MPTTVSTKAYHGTLQSKAKDIIEQKRFKFSTKDIEWLGHGVYFFVYKQHAVEWAKQEADKPGHKEESPCVLSAKLSYQELEFLDLDDPAQLNDVNEFMSQYLDIVSSDSSAPRFDFKTMNKKKKWCFVCNLYRRFHKNIGIIAYTFHFKTTVSGFEQNQRQLCVNRDSLISNIQKEK